MDNQRKKKLVVYIIIAVLSVLGILATVSRCALLIMDNYTIQIRRNLEDVSNQCAETLDTQIDSRYDLLRSIAARLEIEAYHRQEILGRYLFVVDSFRLRRLGFVEKDGTAYATDGTTGNLAYRMFFKRSINGEVYLSDVLEDALSDEHENVTIMSMPVYDTEGNVDAVACITYETSVLSDDLAIKSFDGHGDNFVVNQNGNIVVSSNEDILPIAANISATDLNIKGMMDGDIVTSLLKKEPYEGDLEAGGKEYLFRMTPVSLMDGNTTWFVLSVVPKDYLNSRFDEIQRNLRRMVLIIVVIFFGFGVGARYLFRAQRKLAYTLAFTSQLTGGPNLQKFFEDVKRIAQPGKYIVYMNLEDFAHTSVATGIEKSNQLIKRTWNIINENVHQNETACHDTADSFVMYLSAADNEALAERLRCLRDAIHEDGHSMNIPWVYSKFGVYRLEEGDDVKSAYSKAEYTVFDTWGVKECVSFYSKEDHEKQTMNKLMEENFDDALANRRFEVWYQPKYSVSGEKLTGGEALVRWRKKDGTLISPGLFIPLLESNGEISRLDEYVFESVCRDLRKWKDEGIQTVPVSINVSRATLYRDSIVDKYLKILNDYNLSPSDVQIEVTETIVGGNEKILELLGMFREAGIKILMDDFGTGYSSLSTLNMKCFDTLKIDKSLVDEIGDEYGRIIVYQTIEMGCALGLYVTVEGVENKEQLEILNKTKCNDIQGYFFSKPLPKEDYEKKLIEVA